MGKAQKSDEGMGRIITTLQHRREIEKQIRELVHLRSQDEIFCRVDEIVALGEEVISILIANLDTTDPHFRGALGLVASRLPQHLASPAFRAAALNHSLSDQSRLTAVMILERYLGEEIDPARLEGMGDPTVIALQSLMEVTSSSQADRTLLIEYVRSFQEQPLEVAEIVLKSLQQIPPENQVDLLRMLVQDERPIIQRQALESLSRHRSKTAQRALLILKATTPAALQPTLDRALRKLAFAGIPQEALPGPDNNWRVLVSPIDGQGNQSIWFIQPLQNKDRCRFLSLLINDRLGIKDALGEDDAPAESFPDRGDHGTLHAIPLRNNLFTLSLLETDFEYGRRLVRQGMSVNFERGTPVPIEFRLLSDLIWGYQADEEVEGVALPRIGPSDGSQLLPRTAALLERPDFATWFLLSSVIYDYAEGLQSRTSPGQDTVSEQWISELVRLHFGNNDVRSLYAGRLLAMSEWYWRAGQADTARLALVAAQAMEQVPPSDHPFLVRLVRVGLGIAITGLNHGLDPRKPQTWER